MRKPQPLLPLKAKPRANKLYRIAEFEKPGRKVGLFAWLLGQRFTWNIPKVPPPLIPPHKGEGDDEHRRRGPLHPSP